MGTLYLILFLQIPKGYFHLGHRIHSYDLGDLNALGNSDQDGCQVFHYHCNLLAPRNHFGVCAHHTQSVRQVGSITPFQGLSITCMLFPRSRVFIQPCIILDEKVSSSSFFVILTASFKSVRSTVWFATVSL